MKTLFLTMMIALATSPAFAQDKIGNGGDEVALEFTQAFNSAVSTINTKLPYVAELITRYKLNEKIATATILITDGQLPVSVGGVPQSSIATNDPKTGQIVIQRARWKELTNNQIKEALALHEVASLAGLESTGNYQISSLYLSLFKLPISPADAFKSACGSVEYGILERTREDFNVGEKTATDVAIADYDWQKALFNKCGATNKYLFCSSAEATLKFMLMGLQEESRVGQRTSKEVNDAMIELDNHRHFCR